MRIYAQPDPIRQAVYVYVELGTDEQGRRTFDSGEPGKMPVAVPMGAEPPRYMTVPMQIAEKIGEALAPRPDVTERHLDDAIVVRDRALTLVEILATQQLPRIEVQP